MAKKIDLSGLPNFDNIDENSIDYPQLYRKALNWIHVNVDSKIIYNEALQYLKNNDCDIDLFEELEEWRLMTIGKIAILIKHGVPIRDNTTDWLIDKVESLEKIAKFMRENKVAVDSSESEDDGEKPLILKAKKMATIILETLYDAVIITDDVSPFKYLAREGVTSTRLIIKIVDFIKEFYGELDSKTKKEYEKSKLIHFALSEIEKYIQNVRMSKKSNKVSNVQMDKVKFKKGDENLKIISISPTLIVGAKALVVYNGEYNQLGIYHALEGGLSIKGTTIQNFDETKSKGKRVKKPSENIPNVRNMTLSIVERFLKEQPAVESSLSGRLTEDVLLIKSFK